MFPSPHKAQAAKACIMWRLDASTRIVQSIPLFSRNIMQRTVATGRRLLFLHQRAFWTAWPFWSTFRISVPALSCNGKSETIEGAQLTIQQCLDNMCRPGGRARILLLCLKPNDITGKTERLVQPQILMLIPRSDGENKMLDPMKLWQGTIGGWKCLPG